jgi:hypothetical protein
MSSCAPHSNGKQVACEPAAGELWHPLQAESATAPLPKEYLLANVDRLAHRH